MGRKGVSEVNRLPRSLSPEEVASLEGLNVATVTRMCRRGQFTGAYKTGGAVGGQWRIPETALVEYRQRQIKATEAEYRDRQAEETEVELDPFLVPPRSAAAQKRRSKHRAAV